MYEELLSLWKTKQRILARWDDPILAGVKYQLDKCILDLESELGYADQLNMGHQDFSPNPGI